MLIKELLDIQHVQTENAIKMLNTHCKDALWMLEKDLPLYRGDFDVLVKSFAIVDPSKTSRVSANTTNHYTLILDNIPSMSDFPKRSRSLICSTDIDSAAAFADEEQDLVSVIIPFDNVKIGYTGEPDIWHVNAQFGAQKDALEALNALFSDLNDKDWKKFLNEFKSLANEVRKLNPKTTLDSISSRSKLHSFASEYFEGKDKPIYDLLPIFDDIENQLNLGYGPAVTGMKWFTTSNLPKRKQDVECWVGGPCIMINQETWKLMRQNFKH